MSAQLNVDALAGYEASFQRTIQERDPRAVAELLRNIGKVHWDRGDFESATDYFSASVAVAEAHSFRDILASSLNWLGIVTQFRVGPAETERLYARALKLARELGNSRLVAMVEQNLGTLASIRGDLTQALERYTLE